MDFKKHSLPYTSLPQDDLDGPEKENSPLPPEMPSFARRFPRRIIAVGLITLIIMALLSPAYRICQKDSTVKNSPAPLPSDTTTDSEWIFVEGDSSKVQLEAHIMSKCPDAKDCLEQLVVPAMQRVHDRVDFRLSFIGSLDPLSDEVTCMHGPSECLGNMIILCAEKLYPEPKLHLGFANCMISDFRRIPQRDMVEECAMEHGLDFQKINACISEEGEGSELLRKSVERSSFNHVRTSCTVRLNGNVRCVRDGGVWRDCEGGSSVDDLVKDVDELYSKAASS